ncbi:MAG: fatty acid hydroxylase family protein [Alphaproteobacteria bacterium]|nr:MAG: fatty acid hydroxylase family protein [Alphaproteobacteria bacterium]
MSVAPKIGFWSNKSHYLNKMTLRQLVVAYFQYYAIQVYLLLAAASAYVAATHATALLPNLLAVGLAVLVYPLAWYILHRWVLHSRWMFRSPLTAKVWKRIHYDHHQDPHHLEVLFGALYTTLPTVALVTLPIGWALDGLGGAATAFATGLLTTCFYEFCHCIQHLSYKPRNRMLKAMKQNHMAHHFHDERGNYGITNFAIDRLFGTFYRREARPEKSPTVFNLGYDEAAAARYPWVARLSGGLATGTPRDRRVEQSGDTPRPA